MAKRLFIVAWMGLSSLVLSSATAGESRVDRMGEQRVVHLFGSPYEVGKAHGELLAKEIQANVARLSETSPTVSDEALAAIPPNLRDEMRGVADGAKVSPETIESLNLATASWTGPGQMGAGFGKRTLGGRLLHVYSMGPSNPAGKDPVIFVHHPAEGLRFVRVAYPGLVGALVGVNDEGISVSTLCWPAGETLGVPLPLHVRKVLEESKSLVSAVQDASAGELGGVWTAIIADGKIPSARIVEIAGAQSAELGPNDSAEPVGIEEAVRRANQPLSPRLQDSVTSSSLNPEDQTRRYEQIGELFTSGRDPISTIDVVHHLRSAASSSTDLQIVCNASDLELWVAAGNDRAQGYDVRDLLAGRASAESVRRDSGDRPISPESARKTVQTIKPKPRKGEASIPKMYRVDSKPFDVEATPFAVAGGIVSTMVKIPSPVVTEYPENNTIPAEFFRPRGDGPWPYVIVTHIAGGDFELSRFVSRTLASNGIATVFIKLPYYGERRPAGRRDIKMLAPDVGIASGAMAQAVQDIRRVVDWIEAQPDLDGDKIGICGISLGSITGALATAIEPRLTHACLIIGGGSLADLVFESVESEAREYRKLWTESGGTRESLREVMAPFDPVTYPDRLKKRVIFMINADQDESVPVSCNKALWEAAGRQRIVWYPCGHYTIVQYLMPALQHTVQFFRAWPDRDQNK